MATANLYTNVFRHAFNKEIDWDSDTIKVMLLTAAYTPNQDADDYLDDIVANEITGTGYTAGGATLTGKTVTKDDATNTIVLDADDVEWTDASITARHAVVYDATPGTNATRPLIGYITFDSDKTSSNATFAVRFDATGVARFSAA